MSEEEIEKAWSMVLWYNLPLSFKVDFCQFLAGIKPAVRTRVLVDHTQIQPFVLSLKDFGWHPILDDKNYLVISKSRSLSEIIMQEDQSLFPHASKLGHLLGYPGCCVSYIEQFGESEIDKVAEGYKRECLKGPFILLDISQYLEGIALISHIPCSYECKLSLDIALSVFSFIQKNSRMNGYSEWAISVEAHFKNYSEMN